MYLTIKIVTTRGETYSFGRPEHKLDVEMHSGVFVVLEDGQPVANFPVRNVESVTRHVGIDEVQR